MWGDKREIERRRERNRETETQKEKETEMGARGPRRERQEQINRWTQRKKQTRRWRQRWRRRHRRHHEDRTPLQGLSDIPTQPSLQLCPVHVPLTRGGYSYNAHRLGPLETLLTLALPSGLTLHQYFAQGAGIAGSAGCEAHVLARVSTVKLSRISAQYGRSSMRMW